MGDCTMISIAKELALLARDEAVGIVLITYVRVVVLMRQVGIVDGLPGARRLIDWASRLYGVAP